MAPQLTDYFLLSMHDDDAGAHRSMGMRASWGQIFFTTASMIAMIDSILVGVFGGLLLYHLFNALLLWCLVIAIGLCLLSVVLHQLYQWKRWRRADRHLPVLFPSAVSSPSSAPSR